MNVREAVLLDDFKDGCEQLCKEFSLDFNKIEFDEDNGITPIGEYYRAHLKKGEFEIDFVAELLPQNENHLELSSNFTIRESKTSSSYTYKIRNLESFLYGNSLVFWIMHKSYEHKINHHPVNFKQIFGSSLIQIYGVADVSEPTNTIFSLILAGLDKLKADPIIVYQFRHLDKEGHFWYSYSVFLPNRLWICFPHAAGGGGGGGQDDFEFFEEELNKHHNFKINREFRDVDYDSLELFLKDNALKFPLYEPEIPLTILDPIKPYEKIFGKEYVKAFLQFADSYKNKEYSNALRDLRALVQHGLEIVIKKKCENINLKQNELNIWTLSDILIKEKILKEELKHWFSAFSSVANNSSHRLFPDKNDLETPNVEDRVILAISVGMYLIHELDVSLRKECTVSVEGETFKIFLPEGEKLDANFEIINDED